MINISERCRKVLRTVFRGIGVSVVSLIIQACYGILPPDTIECEYGMPAECNQETSIYGKVVSKETGKPIFGIQVSIENIEETKKTKKNGYWDRTDKYGNFSLWPPTQKVYKLKFKDVDGQYNGGLFKEQTWTLKQNDTDNSLLIGMDLDTESDVEIIAE
jgi:putative lipoprotein (rSAM/lipoprotein system)